MFMSKIMNFSFTNSALDFLIQLTYFSLLTNDWTYVTFKEGLELLNWLKNMQ